MRVNGFIGLHSCSGRQWGPQCLAVLVDAQNIDNGRDATNSRPTALLHVKLEHIIDIWIRNACERFTRFASCSVRQWGPQCLVVLVDAPKTDKGRDSTNT